MSVKRFLVPTVRARVPVRVWFAVSLAFLGPWGCLVSPLSVSGAPINAELGDRTYAVVVSEDTYARREWREVVDTLVAKHHAGVIRYTVDVNEAAWELSARMPDRVCFVARPEEAGREYVISVHQLTRRLDADPYTDAMWGILTGYEAGDALRIAKRTEPLMIRRGASGAGVGNIECLPDGFASSEGSKNDFWVRADGKTVQSKVDPDACKALAEGFNTLAPEIFFTSGHATERDWQVGYNFNGGQFLCNEGQLYARNSKGERVDIHSPSVKVYLPMGNCLIGRIPQADCMVAAWLHSGGVHQMFGYTVVTWFGFMGWGTGHYFSGGRNNLAESFYFTQQALLHRLHTEYPRWANVEPGSYEPDAIGNLFTKHGLLKKEGERIVPERTAAGLIWDRDTVAFYGDPGWDARMPQSEAAWQQAFAVADGKAFFTLTATRDGHWPDKPIITWLPSRLADARVVKDAGIKALITDNFLLLPLSGAFKQGDVIQVEFSGKPMVRPDRQSLDQLRAAQELLSPASKKVRAGAIVALGKTGDRRVALLDALRAVKEDRRNAMALLLAKMPEKDLRTADPAALIEKVRTESQPVDRGEE